MEKIKAKIIGIKTIKTIIIVSGNSPIEKSPSKHSNIFEKIETNGTDNRIGIMEIISNTTKPSKSWHTIAKNTEIIGTKAEIISAVK